jgi:predicted protein tyrosine phosphatase
VKQPPYILSICGKHEVERFSELGVTHLLSLEDPGTVKATPGWFGGPHVQLHLHDLDSPQEAAHLQGVVPTKEHVRQILEVGDTCLQASHSGKVHLLIHCYAGISRSTAAAYVVVAQALGVEHAGEALKFVLRTRPEAYPNQLIVRHADRMLQGNGRLLAALQPLREQFSRAIEDWIARGHNGSGSGPD